MGLWDGEPLFTEACKITGVTDVHSWYEWRDVVQDRITLLRVQLFKNPATTDITGTKAPTVTFDYTKAETVQSFSGAYEYSLDQGRTWTTCDGGPIRVKPPFSPGEIKVRRIDRTNTDQVGIGCCTVYGIPGLSSSGITVVKNAFGWLVDNLDNRKSYEITFSHAPIEYEYGEALSVQSPAGSYSYLYQTAEIYEYVYIRSIASATSYASTVYQPDLMQYQSDFAVDPAEGKISNVPVATDPESIRAYCDKLGDAASITTATGEQTDQIGTGYLLKLGKSEYQFVVSADVNGDAAVTIDDVEAMVSHVNFEQQLEGVCRECGS